MVDMEEDMTESMQAQLELSKSEEKHQNLIEHLSDGLVEQEQGYQILAYIRKLFYG